MLHRRMQRLSSENEKITLTCREINHFGPSVLHNFVEPKTYWINYHCSTTASVVTASILFPEEIGSVFFFPFDSKVGQVPKKNICRSGKSPQGIDNINAEHADLAAV